MSSDEVVHYQYGVICRNEYHHCNNGRPLELTEEEYQHQLMNPNKPWKCPRCRGLAVWDDDSLVNQ